MSFFKNIFKSKNENSSSYKLEIAKKLDTKILKCVSEREDEIDTILGRNGVISLKDGILSVYADGKTIFRTEANKLSAGEFMSLDGAVLQGVDIDSDKQRTIIVYYKYYRK